MNTACSRRTKSVRARQTGPLIRGSRKRGAFLSSFLARDWLRPFLSARSPGDNWMNSDIYSVEGCPKLQILQAGGVQVFRWHRLKSHLLVAAVFSLSAFAQQPANPPSIPSTGFPGLDQYRASRIAVFTDDYGQLARYREANAALKTPKDGESRVVFFG